MGNVLDWKKKASGNEYVVTFFGIYEICKDNNKDRYYLRRIWEGNYLELNKDKESRLTVQLHTTIDKAKLCMQEMYDMIVESLVSDIGVSGN